VKLPFGKHKGKDITKVPKGYLVWMLSAEFSEDLKDAALRVLKGYPQLEDVEKIVRPWEYCPKVGQWWSPCNEWDR
jgi:uncharacterized protein (DUF3820 family)